eukprot:m.88900 g.88900  ORF g.88900 m.88900 type:complete len:82 (+) comp26244_c3_seq1:204-449(+)
MLVGAKVKWMLRRKLLHLNESLTYNHFTFELVELLISTTHFNCLSWLIVDQLVVKHLSMSSISRSLDHQPDSSVGLGQKCN